MGELPVSDLSALAVALFRDPQSSRLIEIGNAVVTLALGPEHHGLLHLEEAAMRVLVHPSDPGTPLTGWAVDENDLAPVLAVLLVNSDGALRPARPLARPDIRATQGFDYDMTGFEVHRPNASEATLLFILRRGVLVKRITP